MTRPRPIGTKRDAIMEQVLLRIAADDEVTEGGHRKKISRVTMLNLAREACTALGLDFGIASVRARKPEI